jgi:lipid-binding SYLF domain-containing protein
MEASTDLSMRAKILAYSRARGIFAGVALDGSTLRPDNNANEALYGREISAKEIVRRGTVPMPRSARPLIRVLQESSRATADETTSAERK